MFVLAQSMAIAMHLIGFCESLLDMLKQNIEGFEDIIGYGTNISKIQQITFEIKIIVRFRTN